MTGNLLNRAVALVMGCFTTLTSAQTVTLYSSNSREVIDDAVAAVRETHPDLQIKQVRDGSGTLMKRIRAEAATPGGDLFWSGGFGTLAAFPDIMDTYRSPEAKAIAPQFRDMGGRHIGVNVHVMVLMVNTRQLKGLPVPSTWSDLMKPAWKGKVAMADPAKSGTAFIQTYGVFKQFGPDGLEKLARNVALLEGSGEVPERVASGEYPVGITLEASAYKFSTDKQADIKLIYPSEGTYLGPEGMFIIKGAKNTAAAKRLYDALLTKEVQERLLRRHYRRPTRTDLAVSKIARMPELISIKVFPLNLQEANVEYMHVLEQWGLLLDRAKNKPPT